MRQIDRTDIEPFFTTDYKEVKVWHCPTGYEYHERIAISLDPKDDRAGDCYQEQPDGSDKPPDFSSTEYMADGTVKPTKRFDQRAPRRPRIEGAKEKRGMKNCDTGVTDRVPSRH